MEDIGLSCRRLAKQPWHNLTDKTKSQYSSLNFTVTQIPLANEGVLHIVVQVELQWAVCI
jgi:hypothetical protein